jgi:hypothetical protein
MFKEAVGAAMKSLNILLSPFSMAEKPFSTPFSILHG